MIKLCSLLPHFFFWFPPALFSQAVAAVSSTAPPICNFLLIVFIQQKQDLRALIPHLNFGSNDAPTVANWVQTQVVPRWEAFLQTVPAHLRHRHRALMIWDMAPIHRALGRTGDQMTQQLYLFEVPAETTSLISPLDTCGVFRSIKAAARRDALRMAAEANGNQWVQLGERLLSLIHWARAYARQYSIPRSFLECGWATATEGGNHLLHERLALFMRARGHHLLVNTYINEQRVARC